MIYYPKQADIDYNKGLAMDRRQFESLDTKEQARLFYESHFRERADLLLHSREPEGLAQSLTPEELYLVTREMAPEERADVICYASAQQLLFLSDIDCWKKDRISTRRFIDWLETLLRTNERKVLEWFSQMDYEMLVASLKKVMHVVKPEWEYPSDEILRSHPYFTLDQYYHIFVKEDDVETVKRVIECLYERNHGRYVALLEGVMSELDGEMEEEAYHLREMRLADRGFPDRESAYRVFQSISKAEFQKSPSKDTFEGRRGDSTRERQLPDYPMLWSAEKLFLDEVLLLFGQDPPAVQEQIREEFVWLSNKMIAWEGIDFASEARVRGGLERVRYYVNIGVEALSGGDLSQAHEIMRTRWLELILRWGFTQLLRLREEAEKIGGECPKGSFEPFLHFLEVPYENVLRGLLQFVPHYFDRQPLAHVLQLRDFKCLSEVEETRRVLSTVRAVKDYFVRLFPNFLLRIVIQSRRGQNHPTLFPLMGTLYARFVLGEKISDRPLSKGQLTLFLKKGFVKKGRLQVLDPGQRQKFLERSFSAKERAGLHPLWVEVFKRIEDEFGRLDPSQRVDNRFVTSLESQ